MNASLLILCWNLLSGSSEAAPWDVAVASSDGSSVKLGSFLGRPTVLFYEDRHSLETNRDFKDALTRFLASGDWAHRPQVLAVANLQEFNWFPALQFALAGVRRAEVKAGVNVYIDFDGALGARLGSKGFKGSWVVLLSPQGHILYQHQGQLNVAQGEQLLSLLAQASEKTWQKATASTH